MNIKLTQKNSILKAAGKFVSEDINLTVDDSLVGGGTPIEVATEEEMTALLVEANVGNIYKYTGTTTDTYTNGELYQVVSE